jgi:oxygen-independent coproporphyrinogen-3 oxidase
VEKSPEALVDAQSLWLEGIQQEILFWKQRGLESSKIDTIFMGGGTPSLLKTELMIKLSNFLRENLNISDTIEWSLEANPESIKKKLLEDFASCGVNRLSLGIQSFKEEYLRRLERGASPAANIQALEDVSTFWKGRWSLDLMFGLPKQSLEDWRADLEQAMRFNPSHISAYQLTLSTLKSKSWLQPPEESLLEYFRFTQEFLSKHGLNSYEISNFARDGYECQHNLKYWRAEAFLGLGPGAYSLLPKYFNFSDQKNLVGNQGAHAKNPAKLKDWLESIPLLEKKNIEARNSLMHVEELLLVGLRLDKGIELSHFPTEIKLENISSLKELVYIDQGNLKTTPRGKEILDRTILETITFLRQKSPF